MAHDVNHSTLLLVLPSLPVAMSPLPPGTLVPFRLEGGGALSFYLGKEALPRRVLAATKPELGHMSVHLGPFLAKGNELTGAGTHL